MWPTSRATAVSRPLARVASRVTAYLFRVLVAFGLILSAFNVITDTSFPWPSIRNAYAALLVLAAVLWLVTFLTDGKEPR